MVAAITLDGKIAKHHLHNVDWTSKKDKAFFRKEVKKAGVVIFGANTYKAMGKAMPTVLNIVMTKSPKKYKNLETPNSLEFTNASPKKIVENLTQRKFKTVIIGGGAGIYTIFFKNKLIDEIHLTVVPKIFGKGVSLLNPLKISDLNLKLTSTSALGKGEVLLKYKV